MPWTHWLLEGQGPRIVGGLLMAVHEATKQTFARPPQATHPCRELSCWRVSSLTGEA